MALTYRQCSWNKLRQRRRLVCKLSFRQPPSLPARYEVDGCLTDAILPREFLDPDSLGLEKRLDQGGESTQTSDGP